MSRIVVRVDPIIPTEKGLSVAYHTLISFMEMGFQRYRVSVIDMYPHARSRFKKAGLPLPYGDSGFAPSQAQLSKVDDTLDEICTYCSSYYASLEQMVADYGFRGALQIMAECIFEQLGFDDMEFNAEQKSEGAAIKFIHEWMEG